MSKIFYASFPLSFGKMGFIWAKCWEQCLGWATIFASLKRWNDFRTLFCSKAQCSTNEIQVLTCCTGLLNLEVRKIWIALWRDVESWLMLQRVYRQENFLLTYQIWPSSLFDLISRLETENTTSENRNTINEFGWNARLEDERLLECFESRKSID